MEDQPKKKKPYSKPQIWFEDFRISTNIAADCDIKGNQSDANSCGYADEVYLYPQGMTPTTVFAYRGICDTLRPGGGWTDDNIDICLWNGSGLAQQLFNS